MNDPFTIRMRAAAVAGWWTVLIAIGFITLLWAVSLVILSNRPAWVLAMCGPDIGWPEFQRICLWAIVALKFVIWLMVLVVVWLTLWAWQLKKRAGTN